MSKEKANIQKATIKYIQGMPKEYRANCSGGEVRDHVLNKSHKIFRIHPIGYRFFEDRLFADKKKEIDREWVEMFFVDDMNCLSTIMFHGYSVQNLKQLQALIFYVDHNIHEVTIEVSFAEKKNKDDEKYFIAEFEIVDEDLDEEKMAKHLAYAKEMKPYRASTLTSTAKTSLSFNYPEVEEPTEA